jgi:hypothetical protein
LINPLLPEDRLSSQLKKFAKIGTAGGGTENLPILSPDNLVRLCVAHH